MKKMLKGLLIAVLAVSSANATTSKTFLMPRSQGVNLAMEYTTYNELIQHNNGDFFGANFQVTPFYMESSDKSDIGKYFLMDNVNLIKLGTTATDNFNYQNMIHDYNNTNGIGTIKYEPELQAYGARIDYYQDLEKIVDGLYLKIALPIVRVENDMHITTAVSTDDNTFNKANLDKYFQGTYSAPLDDENAQTELKYAKINGSQSETAVADIDVVLGYKFYNNDKYYVAINMGLTIPVGNSPDGEWVFEPVVGNGNHWGFGGGLDASLKLWEDDDQNIKLTAAANYRYLFEGTEKRTLGLKDYNENIIGWGQYYLAGEIGKNRNTIQLLPVANILTQNVDVEPANQFDSVIYFTYNNGGLTIDLGYNFFWKDDESVNMKGTWEDKKYGLAYQKVNMSKQDYTFIVSDNNGSGDNAGGSLGYISTKTNNANLEADSERAYGIDKSVAETQSQNTHKIFGGLGYLFKDMEYPVMVGIGGGYEFAGDNNAIENWQIWGKLGIKF